MNWSILYFLDAFFAIFVFCANAAHLRSKGYGHNSEHKINDHYGSGTGKKVAHHSRSPVFAGKLEVPKSNRTDWHSHRKQSDQDNRQSFAGISGHLDSRIPREELYRSSKNPTTQQHFKGAPAGRKQRPDYKNSTRKDEKVKLSPKNDHVASLIESSMRKHPQSDGSTIFVKTELYSYPNGHLRTVITREHHFRNGSVHREAPQIKDSHIVDDYEY